MAKVLPAEEIPTGDINLNFAFEGEKICWKFKEGHAMDEAVGHPCHGKCNSGFEPGSPALHLQKRFCQEIGLSLRIS